MIYFGWPWAHEDDAERALRAGLAIIEGIDKLKPHPQVTLQVRIGVATGMVVVGETIGEGTAREQTVIGNTPNLAARLQNRWCSNTVRVNQYLPAISKLGVVSAFFRTLSDV